MSDNGAIQGVDIATLGDAKLGSLNDCFMESADKCAEQQLIFNHLFFFSGIETQHLSLTRLRGHKTEPQTLLNALLKCTNIDWMP